MDVLADHGIGCSILPADQPEPFHHRITTREVIALLVIVAFLVAYFIDPSPEMKGALITTFTGAVAYYLGSSKGAAENREALNRLHEKTNGQP